MGSAKGSRRSPKPLDDGTGVQLWRRSAIFMTVCRDIERQNLTMRMQLRRFTRLTNAFSKKLSHLTAACALHFAHYNFCRVHQTLRVTPAMAAGIADHIFSIEEIVDLLYRSGTIAA